MYNFDIATPTTVADAVQALKQEEAQPLSGGQTLIPTLKQRLAMPSVLVSLTQIDEMKGIEPPSPISTASVSQAAPKAVRKAS